MMNRPGLQHKALVAIRTFDSGFIAHLQEDLGMAQRAATAIAGDAVFFGFDDFRGSGRHGKFREMAGRRGS